MITFTEEDIKVEMHKIVFEDDEVNFTATHIIGSGKNFKLVGTAVIEGEVYNEFEIIFETVNEVKDLSAKSIMQAEWDWYDFLCTGISDWNLQGFSHYE